MSESIKIWARETPWRQGHVLPLNAVKSLKLLPSSELEAACVMVISHDRDLANENLKVEPQVEIIVGCLCDQSNGNFSWGKSPRTLHLEVQHKSRNQAIELVATAKSMILKDDLVNFEPDTNYVLSGQAISTLRSWLAIRYNRASFPDMFNRRLDGKLSKSLAKLIEPMEGYLSAVYFIIDQGQEIDRSDGSDYYLKIMLAYPPGDDPDQAHEKVEALKERIFALFEDKQGFVLENCFSISEDDLPVSKAKLALEWRLEHLTLKNLEEN